VGLPETFKGMKLDESLISQIASEAVKSGNLTINPRKATKEDLIAICRNVF
jgi:alcohol dehydrogenase class IV